MNRVDNLRALLASPDQSERLRTALNAGTYPDPAYIDPLVKRSAIEPDFYVREMIVWALIRNDGPLVVDRLLPELISEVSQARSQALHTFTKLNDRALYKHISKDLLFDASDFVAMTAWRAASRLVPQGEELALGNVLIHQLGRGAFDVQHALSRAFCAIGESILPLLENAAENTNKRVRDHARFTIAILKDPWSERKIAADYELRTDILNDGAGEGENC